MKDYSAYSDEELIEMLRSGEDEIMDFILKKYKPLVRKNANARYLVGGENDDLIQEGMIGLFKAVKNYRNDRNSSFFSFAQLCICGQLSTAVEASQRDKNQPLNSYVSFSSNDDEGQGLEKNFAIDFESPEHVFLENENLIEMQEKLLSSLSAMEKQVFELYLDGNEYKQIAEMMGKTPKSIDNALQRIKRKQKKGR